MTVGFPLSPQQVAGMRRITNAGVRLTHDEQVLLLDSYDALMDRLYAVDEALHGRPLGGTYLGADVAARLERERASG